MDKFSLPTIDDPEFDPSEPPERPEYFAPASRLPDHYPVDFELTESDLADEREPFRKTEADGPADLAPILASEHQTPEAPTFQDAGPPDQTAELDFHGRAIEGPQESERFEQEEPEGPNALGPMGPLDQEPAPEREPMSLPFADQRDETEPYSPPEPEEPFGVPALQQEMPMQPEPIQVPALDSDNLFEHKAQSYGMTTYSTPWM